MDKRMTISLTKDTEEAIKFLVEDQGVSIAEVLRKAISTEAYIRRKAKEGYGVQLVKDDSVVEVVFR